MQGVGWADRPRLQAELFREMRQALDFVDLVIRRKRLVAAIHEGLVLDAHVVGRHEVVTEARRHVQHVFRVAVELVEHVFEGLAQRLVRLRLLGRVDLVERRAELGDVAVDLLVGGIRKNHELVFRRETRETFRRVRVRAPRGHRVVNLQRGCFLERHARALAGTANRIHHHVAIRLPCAEHLVQTIAAEELHELVHLGGIELVAVELARGLAHLEVGQRAVAVEGDVLRLEIDHGLHPVVVANLFFRLNSSENGELRMNAN
ncbi:hypothetical protein PSP6_50023 [Paraburkholderia tropica]|nr:hypothetical protein PSP6_50023 [Paraburkholderia tropica]